MSPDTPLLRLLQEEIRAHGPMTFLRFMELCLYHPQLGYYNSAKVRLGKTGDFYTSAHAGPVFARILAQHLRQTWAEAGRPPFHLTELGAGDGQLAHELMSWTQQRFPEMFSCLRYTSFEQSPVLRQKQGELLGRFGNRVTITPEWETAARSRSAETFVCVLANEFFDALPFHILSRHGGEWRERRVCLEESRLAWCDAEPADPLMQRAEAFYAPELAAGMEIPDEWIAEVRPAACPWVRRISDVMTTGKALIFDYGYTALQWRRGRFPQGSALAYRHHRACENLLAHPGDQDLTAHVDFSELIECAEQAGFHALPLESQAAFLMKVGEEDQFQAVFSDCASEAERLRRAQLLKTLILPQGMGESFQVLILEKKSQ